MVCSVCVSHSRPRIYRRGSNNCSLLSIETGAPTRSSLSVTARGRGFKVVTVNRPTRPLWQSDLARKTLQGVTGHSRVRATL